MLGAAEKPAVLRSYGNAYKLDILIETGLYNGHGSGMGLHFPIYYVIDVQEENVRIAREYGYDAWLGDSADVLPTLLSMVSRPALFWLDAHNTSGYDESPDCPLMRELDAILAWPYHAASVVLIDDVRLMNGEFEWPTLAEVEAKLSPWSVSLADDILRAVPK